MECTRIEINLPKIRADLIWKFYIKIRSHYGTFETFGKCRVCSENILFSKHNKDFQEHLKLHPQLWNIYLEKVALSIQPSVTQTDVFDTLKLAALVIDFDSLQEFSLRFPLSRITKITQKLMSLKLWMDSMVESKMNIMKVQLVHTWAHMIKMKN